MSPMGLKRVYGPTDFLWLSIGSLWVSKGPLSSPWVLYILTGLYGSTWVCNGPGSPGGFYRSSWVSVGHYRPHRSPEHLCIPMGPGWEGGGGVLPPDPTPTSRALRALCACAELPPPCFRSGKEARGACAVFPCEALLRMRPVNGEAPRSSSAHAPCDGNGDLSV